jgi:hypothetical protein
MTFNAPTKEQRAKSISDEMMDLVDRLGHGAPEVDPRAWQHLLVYAPKRASTDTNRVEQIATVVKDLIETLMLWNGQASAGLDVKGLAGLRDELNDAIKRAEPQEGTPNA